VTETTAGWAKTFSRGLWVLDSLVIAGSVLVGLWVSGLDFGSPLRGSDWVNEQKISYAWVIIGLITVWSICLQVAGSRHSNVFASGISEYRRVSNGTFLFFILLAAMSFLLRAEPSRLLIGTAVTLGLLGLLLARFCARQIIWILRRRGRMLTTVFFVGTAEEIASLDELLGESFGISYRLIDAFEISRKRALSPIGLERLVDDLRLKAPETDLVVASGVLFLGELLDEFAARLDAVPLRLAIVTTSPGLALARLRFEPEAQTPLIRVREVQLGALASFIKRVVDVTLASLGLLSLAPLFFVISLLIRLDSPGPAFFRQARVGQFGREFLIVKFRTMRDGAENHLQELGPSVRDAGNSVLFKAKNDPRVTRIGRILRRWSLDELPQLINVLKGEMSIVGPRPFLPSEVRQHKGAAHRRLAVLPGMTGLWQVSGRSDLSWEESVKIDLEYVDKWSPLIDFLIVLKTFPAVFRKKGAY